MNIVERYLLQLNTEKQRLRRVTAVLTALSLLVVVTVSWNLRLTGVTLANDASCGYQEHQHSEECPMEKVLICGYSEEVIVEAATTAPTEVVQEEPTQAAEEVSTDAATEDTPSESVPEEQVIPPADSTSEDVQPGHVHSDACYEINYLCGYEEHVHELSCYSDPTADIETAAGWESTIPYLTKQWNKDIAAVAYSQLGNCESETNYLVADDETTRNGITRYGQWYGNPYGEWSSLFVMFCLNYANIPQDAIPWSPGVHNMMQLAQGNGILSAPDSTISNAGNILFMDTDGNGKADKSLIVISSTGEEMTAIAGDWENTVCKVTLSNNDYRVLGYINVAAVQAARTIDVPEETTPEETTEPTDPSEETTPEETTEPTDPSEETTPEETTEPTDPSEETTPEETTEPTDPSEETTPEETTEPTDPSEETTPEEATEPEEIPDETDDSSDDPEITLEMEYLEEEGILRIVAQTSNIDESMFLWQWQVSQDGNDPWEDIEGAEGLIYEFEATEENAALYYRLQGRKVTQARATFALTRGITTTDEESGTITSGAVTPFSINKNNNNYIIDVYAIPVDSDGNRIPNIAIENLGSFTVNSTNKTNVESKFDNSLGTYRSAYFGTETSITVDNIQSVWRNRYSSNNYYLAYSQTDGTNNNYWLNRANNNISLYLRYTPEYTVRFESEGFTAMTETVLHNELPTLTQPGTWSRDGYTLLGWTVNGNEQTSYTYDELMALPVTGNVTYTAQWANFITVSYDLGTYADALYPIDPEEVPYGSSMAQPPTPAWRNNSIAMAFDGWFLDPDFVAPLTASHQFRGDTTLYAKWTSKDEGYFVYFMDFERENQVPLVLMTYSVTEGKTASPYVPGNAPEDTGWDGKWYLDEECTQVYDFSIPVSQMTEYLTGADSRDLYLYPGLHSVCRAIFVTYGTKIDPITVLVGDSINLDRYTPTRYGYVFDGWTLKDGTPVSGEQVLYETITYYATWEAGYVPFEAILRIENANDTGMTQATVLGTWYAKAGSQIRVNSTYSGSGTNRTGNHKVVCVLNGQEYPVYTNAALTQQATLNDVYATYFIYNNSGTTWTDEVNWDDVFTGGELPYSTRPVSSAGDTIINFDYMRVRNDIVFTIPNSSSGAYIDIYKLYRDGLITGSVTYTGTVPTGEGKNVSATGISSTNVRWSYTAASNNSGSNLYTLHDMKYGQRIYEVYPVGGSWLTPKNTDFHWYRTGNDQLFSSRRQDLSADFFSGSGRKVAPYSLKAEFADQNRVALMYAVECLEGEIADFTINGTGYKVQTQLCEVVNHTGDFSIKDLLGCKAGVNPLANQSTKYYSKLNTTTATVGGTSVKTLFGTTYWDYYKTYVGSVSEIDRAYIFYYDRYHLNIHFNFAYDNNGDGANETVQYTEVAFGEKINHYQFGAPHFEQHALLDREGYEFVGWLDANGFVLEAEDWDSMVATGDSENSSMIFIAKWEKVSNNIVEYYEDVSATAPFETHYFDDGSLLEFPTMAVYPEGWVWQEYGEGRYERFDWDVPMYGEYGVKEIRKINGEDTEVNVVRIYGTWDESHTRIVYDPNAAQGGILGTAPEDSNEYTIWQSEVPVASRGSTANADPDAIFVGWQLDRDGIVYQPGDHVPVRWPRTMIFTAQWAKPAEVVHLRYHPNGGTPEGYYPSEHGFDYRKNATASVWNNTGADGSAWYHRTGHTFMGWNTKPDGSGTAYRPGSGIVLTEPVTTLYAQWRKDTHRFDLNKVNYETGVPLAGAVFELYKVENGEFILVESQTTDAGGNITFSEIETGTRYKLVEARPPGGYLIITKTVYFRLATKANSVALEFCDEQGNVTGTPNGYTADYIPGSQHLMMTARNIAGQMLPSTGGIGTHLYVLFGVILMFAPFVYGFRMRRRSERRTGK